MKIQFLGSNVLASSRESSRMTLIQGPMALEIILHASEITTLLSIFWSKPP